jgi:hypothetical protein
MRDKSVMARNVPGQSQAAHSEAYELRLAIRRAAVIQKLIRRHVARLARHPAASVSPDDSERTIQVMSGLLETLEQNKRMLQRALAFGRGRRVLH